MVAPAQATPPQAVPSPVAHPQAAATVDLLTRLLQMLYPHERHLDIVTVADIRRRYPLTGLGVPAMRAIEQAQRIVRATNDYHLIGLCEFHVGLIYLYWRDNRGAGQQFAAARRQWSFVNATAAVCLALFAEGRAQEFALHHEAAMTTYSRAEQQLPRIRFETAQEGLRRFTSTLVHELAQAKEVLRLLLAQAWQDQEHLPPVRVAPDQRRPPQTIAPVPQPVSPVPAAATQRWYQVERRQAGFAPHLPRGAFLLGDTAVTHYRQHDWVVIGWTDTAVTPHLLLSAYQHTPRFPLLALARWAGEDAAGQNGESQTLLLDVGQGPEMYTSTPIGRMIGYWVMG